MRRALAVTVALLFLCTCGGTERPGGIVERWLTSLNQGRAGRPDRYAADELSEQVLPNWNAVDPGELDVIEVGRAANAGKAETWYVPFRVRSTSGRDLRSAVIVSTVEGEFRVTSFADGVEDHLLPSEGGPAIAGGGVVAWLAAIGVAALLILGSIAAMSLVRPRTPA